MAGKSKSSKDKENTENAADASEDETTERDDSVPSESTDDQPVIIEADATDVSENADADSKPDEPTPPSDEDATNESDTPEEPKRADAPPPAVVSESATSRSGTSFFALVVGGLVAGALGYFGASFAPEPEIDTSALSESIAANSAALESISADVASLRDAPVTELPDIDGQLSEITGSLQTLTTDLESLRSEMASVSDDFREQVTALDDRILALESAVPSAGELPMGEELAALRERIAEMTEAAEAQLSEAQSQAASIARAAEEARLAAEAEAEAARAEAEEREAELAARAERQETLIDLRSAIETGAPYATLLEGLGPVPEVLSENAESGVPTLQSLQRAFPSAARAALTQSETVPEDASAGERLAAFLKKRTNARSLTPQDGDTPDAILSRAEALLNDGDLSGALAEIDALPDSGKAAMASWLELAETRTQASNAVDELSATN